jgi:hypothetical protein
MAATVPAQRSAHQVYRCAVDAARFAPVTGHARPWRWDIDAAGLQLCADPVDWPTAPALTRSAMLDCGAQLYFVRRALGLQGYRPVVRHCDLYGEEPLVRIDVSRPMIVPRGDLGLRALCRPALRGPGSSGAAVAPWTLDRIRRDCETEGAGLYTLHCDQVLTLTELNDLAHRVAGPPCGAATLRRQLGSQTALSNEPVIDALRDTYAVLLATSDTDTAWLHAGEGLPAAGLAAIDCGIAVSLSPTVVEVTATRGVLTRMVAGSGYPMMVLRLSVVGPDPQHTAGVSDSDSAGSFAA